MNDKIILKPTDYVVSEEGEIGYSYSFEDQYSDGENLNKLSKEALLDERDRRWKAVQEMPLPSRISKYALARDMALAKGYDVREADQNINESRREF